MDKYYCKHCDGSCRTLNDGFTPLHCLSCIYTETVPSAGSVICKEHLDMWFAEEARPYELSFHDFGLQHPLGPNPQAVDKDGYRIDGVF